MTENSTQLLFAKKEDLLISVAAIYDSLIEITQEVDKIHEVLRNVERNQNELTQQISHLRNIISKDLTIRGVSPHMLTTTLRDLKMSKHQWLKYITSPTSSVSGGDQSGSDDTSSQSKYNTTQPYRKNSSPCKLDRTTGL